jgi:methyl-accepting chemotaxis protein
MQLWIKIGIPIGVLTLAAVAALMSQDQSGYSVMMIILGVLTVVFAQQSLAPLSEVTGIVERIASGDLKHEEMEAQRSDEIGRLARATNKMVRQLNEIAGIAREMTAGHLGVVDVEERVLKSGRLYDADVAPKATDGDLERTFISLANQMRRLTIQARVISQDNLHSPLLDERVPGELGDSFAQMVRNLRTIADRAKHIAAGDLTSDVEGNGDLTSAFNQMVTSLNRLMQRIVETALQISTASEEIQLVLQDQELAASHQASSVEETQRTMETLLASARKIADSTQTVFKSAEKTQANNRIVADRIGELKSHTARITEILETIKSIADRSDLLALNASLEGMRAGEAGKGFTLVAAEMRRLAENIKDSVGDIKELVSDIRESSLSSVMSTEEGSRLSEQTTETALKISLITQQQQSGTEQVTQSMDELSHLINQGVAGTRQVTTAAKDLAAASEALRYVVEKFKVASEVELGPQSQRDLRPLARAEMRPEVGRTRSGSVPGAIGQEPGRKREATPMQMGSEPKEQLRSKATTEHGMSFPPEEEEENPRSQETPTVEFSTMSDNDGLLDDLASLGKKRKTKDGKGEFAAIAREIEAASEEEEEGERDSS